MLKINLQFFGGNGAALRTVGVEGDDSSIASIETVMNRASFEKVDDGLWQMDSYYGGGEIEYAGPDKYLASAWNGRGEDWFTERPYNSLKEAKKAIKDTIKTRTTSHDVP